MVATSYNGWPASKNPKAIGVNAAWEPIPGHRFPGGIKAGDVETVATHVVRQLDERVEPIDRDAVKDEWGYYFKPSANSPHLISCHSSATAWDYNATRHPNGKRRTFTRAQAAEINRILEEVDRVIQWRALIEDGGCARSAPDEMHFEVGYVTASQVAAVAARLRNEPDPIPKPDEPTSEEDEMLKLCQTIDGTHEENQFIWAYNDVKWMHVSDVGHLESGTRMGQWDHTKVERVLCIERNRAANNALGGEPTAGELRILAALEGKPTLAS